MSGDYRSLLAAFAGLALVSTSFGLGAYVTALNQPEQERYERYTYPAEKEEDAWTSVTNESRSTEYRRPCEQPKGHDESDLCAQWKAARAAERGALWTERGFWAGLGSIVGLGLTIMITLRALARAREANEIAVDAQRAWIILDVRPRWIAKKDEQLRFIFDAVAKNTGQTAAENFLLAVRWYNFVDEAAMAAQHTEWRKKFHRQILMVPPGGEEILSYRYKDKHDPLIYGTNDQGVEVFVFLVLVSAFYTVLGKPNIVHEVSRPFLLGDKTEGAFMESFPRTLDCIAGDDISVLPFGSRGVQS